MVSPDKTSSIVTSSISYRVLLPHDLFRLSNNTEIVLVVDKESYGFEKSILRHLSNDELLAHERAQDGGSKYEFRMILCAFTLRDQFLTNSVNDREQLLRYNQGDGMSLKSVEYPLLRYLVRILNILYLVKYSYI